MLRQDESILNLSRKYKLGFSHGSFPVESSVLLSIWELPSTILGAFVSPLLFSLSRFFFFSYFRFLCDFVFD